MGRNRTLPVRAVVVGQWLEWVAVGVACVLIQAYRMTIGTQLIGSCRFEPSCSRYAEEALRRFGVLEGGRLTLRRLSRCRPLGESGWDPVPD